MEAFPILSIGASFQNFSQDIAVDPTIRSEFEDGTILSRARFTTTKKTFNVVYNFITAGDKVLLEALQDAVNIGADTFTWVNPAEDQLYTVRLLSPMKFQVEPRNFSFWSVSLSMAEA
jgi:hypothetical protein